MPQPFKIDRLVTDDDRGPMLSFADSRHASIDTLRQWLADRGYTVSGSAVANWLADRRRGDNRRASSIRRQLRRTIEKASMRDLRQLRVACYACGLCMN